ncbi:Phosphopantothenoylcysteine decarboxylase / Phosphopantothenoylcysteine synthetase [Pseudonocardia sp. Ae168_Ps1]|nr:Phosphopantothenoylcysteine decarboxylase / Phosphopantothenoylcysteine synthetase [Pseudonocardia sp. Ae168_Ps1]
MVCGAPLARRAADVARALAADGWSLAVGVTEAATGWIEPDVLAEAAAHPVATRPRHASEQRRGARPKRVVTFPLTFNTANKIAAGIMDTHVTGTLCDALGAGTPILAVPMLNDRLWGHPAWPVTLDRLAESGALFLDPVTGDIGVPRPVPSGSGAEIVAGFDPAWVINGVAALGGGSDPDPSRPGDPYPGSVGLRARG